MGCRLIDEYFARTKATNSGNAPCKDFKQTCRVISGEAFKMFLGVEPDI